ncbi:MAG: molybdopterin-dependent oxidoreductase [Actinomycetota bacterium]|nr:molybdopterin-dependent oxidoreductase [Actinomycetota bacterium]
MTELTINGKKVQAEPNATILKAALDNGIYIPHLCWDSRLAPYGGCRLCLVEIEGQKKLLASCSTPAEAGMVVHTETPKLAKARRTVLELLLVHHPLDCPVCDKAGECELQDLAFKYGPSESRFADERKHAPEANAAPLIERNPNRCILCGKCVRVCKEHQGVGAINLIGRGFESKVSPAFEETLDCEFCGQCVDACPVGALGTKPSKFGSRVWFLEDRQNICPYCGVGCAALLGIREGKIARVQGKEGVGINNGDLCSRGRFGFDYIGSEHRLTTPLLRKNGNLEPASWQEALEYTAKRINEIKAAHGPDAIGAIGSERCSVEDNYMLVKFMREAVGSGNIDSRASLGFAVQAGAMEQAFGAGLFPMDINAPLKSDCLFVLESDLTSTHPVYGLKLIAARQQDASLIVADWRESKLARWGSSWLRIRPATGVALVNGIMSVLIEEGLYSKNTEKLNGFEALKKGVAGYTAAKVAQITGINEDEIRFAARELAGAKNPMLLASFGSAENTKNRADALALINLCLLLGRGPESLGFPPELANSAGMLAAGVKPAVNGTVNGAASGKGLKEMLYDGAVKAMYIMGENPAVTFPDSSNVEQVLKGLELLVVQDIMMTATARLAHVVLPAASWAEKEGTFIGLSGKPERSSKCLHDTGGSLPDWKILSDLARLVKAGGANGHSGEGPGFDMVSAEAVSAAQAGFADASAVAANASFNFTEQETPDIGDGGYPLTFVTGNLMQHSGSLSSLSKNLGSVSADAYLQINPADADKRSIKNDDYVKITSKTGKSILLKANVTGEVPAGTVFAPSHFAHSGVNMLTALPRNGAPPVVPVKIEPA